jgi:hypothetical protein
LALVEIKIHLVALKDQMVLIPYLVLSLQLAAVVAARIPILCKTDVTAVRVEARGAIFQ